MNIFDNPIWCAMTIVACMLIIVYFIFYDIVKDGYDTGDHDHDIDQLLFRTSFYCSIIVYVLFFVHYEYVMRKFNKNDKVVADVVNNAIINIDVVNDLKVTPDIIRI